MFKCLNIKFDFKITIIAILLIVSQILLIKIVFNDDINKKERELLETKNKKLQEQKIKLEGEFNNLQSKFSKDSIELIKIQSEISNVNVKIQEKESQINKINKELKDFKNNLNNTKLEIENLQTNPIKRTGNELLESIKEKTK